MYKLYYDSGGSNMAPHAALKELGLPHELIRVDLAKGEQHADWFRKINPHGKVPALVHDNLSMYESAAILMYLCDRHPEGGLAPAPNSAERGLYFQWLTYLTNTPQEALLHWFHADWYVSDVAGAAALKAAAPARLDLIWSYLDGVLAKSGPYLLGAKFSAADLFLFMLVRWTRNMPKPATTYPAIKRNVDLVRARPAVQAMMQAEGIS
jgi:glutathione S-transferase